jgi:hypothetical protein
MDSFKMLHIALSGQRTGKTWSLLDGESVIISGVTLIVKAWSASSEYLLFNVPANIDPSEWVVLTEHWSVCVSRLNTQLPTSSNCRWTIRCSEKQERKLDEWLGYVLEHFRRRLAAADASVARFVIKGVTSHHKKHKGRFPAIAEEVMLTLAQNKPVYIAGAFDGAAAILGSLLGLAHPRRGDVARSLQAKPAHKEKSLQAIARELQPGPWTDLPITAEELIPFLKLYALGGSKWPNNGLTFEENRELFACRDENRIIGTAAIAWTSVRAATAMVHHNIRRA